MNVSVIRRRIGIAALLDLAVEVRFLRLPPHQPQPRLAPLEQAERHPRLMEPVLEPVDLHAPALPSAPAVRNTAGAVPRTDTAAMGARLVSELARVVGAELERVRLRLWRPSRMTAPVRVRQGSLARARRLEIVAPSTGGAVLRQGIVERGARGVLAHALRGREMAMRVGSM